VPRRRKSAQALRAKKGTARPRILDHNQSEYFDSNPRNGILGAVGAMRARAWQDRIDAMWEGFKKPAAVAVFVCLWVPAVGFGMWTLLQYSNKPGPVGAPLAKLPDNAPVAWAPGRANLLMFVHPQCPCSRASIGELALIMTAGREKLQATVFFYRPASMAKQWARTDLWESAAAIPGVHPVEDYEGNTARRFGARTSGVTLFYDTAGRLQFSGGITASRGHSGDNAGRDAIVALLRGETPHVSRTPAFGCSLINEE
jgi:hypothetical protein